MVLIWRDSITDDVDGKRENVFFLVLVVNN